MVFGTPSIAQLVERRTVDCDKTSLGRWFESGSKEIFKFQLHHAVHNMRKNH